MLLEEHDGAARPRLSDGRRLLVVLAPMTWQAYNLYPEDGRTGASFVFTLPLGVVPTATES